MPKITIDGIEIEAGGGQTILDAARRAGIKIPTLCYYDRLSKAGACRMCLVEVEKAPKLMTACTTEIRDGMGVRTDTDKVRKARRGVIEFLLINHPLDCPVCDQAGDCELQDLAFEYGAPESRYKEEKLTFAKIDLGPHLVRDQNRCLNCRRCVRFTWENLKTHDFGATGRGCHTVIGPYAAKSLDGEFIGNVIDICPVGALTDRRFRFKSRVWDLEMIPARARNCSHRCQVILGLKDGEIIRVTARKNENGCLEKLICDKCRFDRYDWKYWEVEV